MKIEQANQLTDNALGQLISALEQGRSETLTVYLNAMAKFRQYSYANVLLIATQRPGASRVAGFHTWRKLGRWVRKGEKGIAIFAPIMLHKGGERDERRDEEQLEQPGVEPAEKESHAAGRLTGFKVVHVYDIGQTEGRDLPEFAEAKGDPQAYMAALKRLVAERGITLEYSEGIRPAKGVSTGGKITLLPGQTPAEEFSVLAHELAHLCCAGRYVEPMQVRGVLTGWDALCAQHN
jgi:hypothetical protein